MSIKETLSSKEENAINELQMRMKNCLTPCLADEKLLYYRFLKARDFDVNKAEQMLKKHIIWRKVNQIDYILEDFKPAQIFHEFIELSVIGYDKDGDAVLYCAGGKTNPSDIMKCFTNTYIMKQLFWNAERAISELNEENERTGSKAYKGSAIFDLDQVPFAVLTSKATVNICLQVLNNYQDNYPERTKSILVTNVPSFFVLLFSILKTVISHALLNKFEIYGKSGWKERLREMMDEDNLPAFLGGNKTDPDGNPLCKTFINHAGKIPERYFLSDEDRYFKDLSQVKKIIIPPSEKVEIDVKSIESGSWLEWEFFVKGKDVGFGITMESPKLNRTEIFPVIKYNTSDGCERNSYKCRNSGNCKSNGIISELLLLINRIACFFVV